MLSAGAPLFRAETVALFTSRQTLDAASAPRGTSRALGWDTPSSPSQSGKYFSSSSYGHLGYTGTSLWIDPLRDLVVCCLTNRVYYGRDNADALAAFRVTLHQAIANSVEIRRTE